MVPKDVFDSTARRDHEDAQAHGTRGAKKDDKQRHAQFHRHFLQPIVCVAKIGIDFFRVQQHGQFDLAERVDMLALQKFGRHAQFPDLEYRDGDCNPWWDAKQCNLGFGMGEGWGRGAVLEWGWGGWWVGLVNDDEGSPLGAAR